MVELEELDEEQEFFGTKQRPNTTKVTMADTCRLCLSVQTDGLTRIFGKGKTYERLRSRILDCCPVTLFQDDILPNGICDQCLKKLAITYEFREQCRKSEETLRSRYESCRWSQSNCFSNKIWNRSVQTGWFDRSGTRIVPNERRTMETKAVRVERNDEGSEREKVVRNLLRINRKDDKDGKKSSRIEQQRMGSVQQRKSTIREESCRGGGRQINENIEIEHIAVDEYINDRDFVGNLGKSTYNVEKRYLCDVCSKTFASKSGLRFHLKSHNGAKPHQCRYCGKGFAIPSYAKRHERIHEGEKRFVCHVCSATFASSNGLKYHLKLHSGEADYACEICGKSFYRRKYLQEHVYTHTGEKPFVCKTCGSRYGNSGSLFVHQKKCKNRARDSEKQ